MTLETARVARDHGWRRWPTGVAGRRTIASAPPNAIGLAMNSTTHATACHLPKSNTSWWRAVAARVGSVRANTAVHRIRSPGHPAHTAAAPNTRVDAT